MSDTGIGAAVRRKEDVRFLTGKGRYTDDIDRPGQLYAHMVRSPHAHARIGGVDTSAAEAAPGVVAVLTGKQMADDGVASLPCGWQIHSADGEPMAEPGHPALAVDTVRHVGDQVAVVVAETRHQAREAAALVEVDYEDLPAAASIEAALADGAPRVHDDVSGNLCFDWEIGDAAATAEAFGRADHVATLDLVNQRLVPNAIEPRVAIGDYDAASDMTTLYTSSQNPHLIRLLLGAFVMGLPEHKLRVVSPDVGGGFGSKIFHYAEEVIVTWAARRLGRPVKWTATRSESFQVDAHGRDHVTRADLALAADGTFLGLKVDTKANLGAYLSTFGSAVPTYLYGTLFAGCYKTPAIHGRVQAVFTQTSPLEYDTGDYAATLDLALELADWEGFEARREEARARGKLRGIGLSTFVEACGIAPSSVAGALGARAGLYESGQIRVHPTGSVTVFTGTHSHGQGHETTFAQIVSEHLGVELDAVEVVHGDSDKSSFGMGTYGSRSLAVGGNAIYMAMQKVIEKGRKIAAHMMEASPDDVEFDAGVFRVAGTDKEKSLGEVALTAYVPHDYPADLEPGLDETAFYDPKNFTFPAGAHVVEVEIDPDTGVVELVNVTCADDVGTVINPMIVEGQMHGGLAQGIGQALLEQAVYDESGQLVTGSYMNYTMPRAADLPFFTLGRHITECTHNPLGVKGVGEVGSIGVPPAVINAVVDALAHLGVTHVEMPATPQKVWKTIQTAQA